MKPKELCKLHIDGTNRIIKFAYPDIVLRMTDINRKLYSFRINRKTQRQQESDDDNC